MNKFQAKFMNGGDSVMIDGCEYIGEMKGGLSIPGSEVIAKLQFNPRVLAPNSRLATFATLFERFEFVPSATSIHFAHASATSVSGSLIHGTEPDPKDNFPNDGVERIRYLTNHKQNATFCPWQSSSVRLPDRTPRQPEYYIDTGSGDASDVRLTVQSEYHCVIKSELGNGYAGGFWVHYRVKLFQAKFDTTSVRTFLGGSFENPDSISADDPVSEEGMAVVPVGTVGQFSNWNLPFNNGYNGGGPNPTRRIYVMPTGGDVENFHMSVQFYGTFVPTADASTVRTLLGPNILIDFAHELFAGYMHATTPGAQVIDPTALASPGDLSQMVWSGYFTFADKANVKDSWIEFSKVATPTLDNMGLQLVALPASSAFSIQKDRLTKARKKMTELRREMKAIEAFEERQVSGTRVPLKSSLESSEDELKKLKPERKTRDLAEPKQKSFFGSEQDMRLEDLEASEPDDAQADMTKSKVIGIIGSLFKQATQGSGVVAQATPRS